MLTITIPPVEEWDEERNEFVYTKEYTLQLEHSLVSLSKWESKWNKPFLTKAEKSQEEIVDYIRCMTITQNIDPVVYNYLTNGNIQQIYEYIESPMTATTFSKQENVAPNREIITAELIYYWMIALEIPFECQKWHLNRLMTLIRVCNIKNQPPKKQGRKALLSRNAALNKARRAQLGTLG